MDQKEILQHQEIAEAIFNEFTLERGRLEIETVYDRKRMVAGSKSGFGDISFATIKNKDTEQKVFLLELWQDRFALQRTPFYGSMFYVEFSLLKLGLFGHPGTVIALVGISDTNWINSLFAGIILEILQKTHELLQQVNKKTK
jgi:hypothetical protein